MKIAIDGPAASGKGTLARRLATHFGLPHLDTGLLYRGLAFNLLAADEPLDDERIAAVFAAKLDTKNLDAGVLSQHEIGQAASKVAVMPKVRRVLLDLQRNFPDENGAVLDGRDIGTVVLPQADVKLFITADPEIRAQRRLDQALNIGRTDVNFDQFLADILERDARDAGRSDAPMKPAEDAILIDTSKMDIEQALLACLEVINSKRQLS